MNEELDDDDWEPVSATGHLNEEIRQGEDGSYQIRCAFCKAEVGPMKWDYCIRFECMVMNELLGEEQLSKEEWERIDARRRES